MRRGTTPTHTFTLPFEVPEGAKVRIVYAQNEQILVEHTTEKGEIEVSGAVISTRLSDKETLRFDCRAHFHNGHMAPYPAEIQIGIKTPLGDKLWSETIETDVERCLRMDGVI